MTRPTITTTRPVTSPVTTPVRSPFGPPKASPFGPAMFRPNPFSASPFAPAASGGKSILRSPFTQARKGGDPRMQKRRRVILTVPGAERHKPWVRLVMPVEELEMLWEIGAGEAGLAQPGYGHDFDEAAQYKADQDGFNMRDLCQDLEHPWCLPADNDDAVHLHPLHAAVLEATEIPLGLVDLSSHIDYIANSRGGWKELLPTLLRARDQVAKKPTMLFQGPQAGQIARGILEMAGFDSYPMSGPQAVEVVLSLSTFDASVAAALKDIGGLVSSHLVDGLEEVANELDMAVEMDWHIRHPDQLQFLCFDPKDFPDDDLVNGDLTAVPLLGSFTCVETIYRSTLDEPVLKDGWEWVIGWREATLRRDQNL